MCSQEQLTAAKGLQANVRRPTGCSFRQVSLPLRTNRNVGVLGMLKRSVNSHFVLCTCTVFSLGLHEGCE